MIVTQGPAVLYAKPTLAPQTEPAPDAAVVVAPEQAPKGNTRGLALLAGNTAAVLIAQQAVPAQQEAASAGLDLRGRDLREVDLTTLDLRGANLGGADLSGKDMSGLDLSGATLTDAKLDGTTLTDAKLDGVKARGASFKGAMLLRTGMDGADLSNAKFNNAFIAGTPRHTGLKPLEEQQAGKYFSITSADFTSADFSGAEIQTGTFSNSTFDGATFNDVTANFGLTDSSAKNVSFQRFSGGVGIRGGNLSGADFSNIDGARVSIYRSKVDGVSFAESRMILSISDTDARGVDFAMRNRTIENASFTNVDMRGLDFGGYKFKSVHFEADARSSFPRDRTDAELSDGLKGTSFAGATFDMFGFSGRAMDLNKANFDGARLTHGSFDGGARIDQVKAIRDGLSAGRIFYATPGFTPNSGASPDSPARAWSSPEDQKIENWLYSLMPPPDKTDRGPAFQLADAAVDPKTSAPEIGDVDDTMAKPFDMRQALIDAGALPGAAPSVGQYSYLGDLFKDVQVSKDQGDAHPSHS